MFAGAAALVSAIQRTLPWRGETDYRILVSEVMLQQTRWPWWKTATGSLWRSSRLSNAWPAHGHRACGVGGLGYYRRGAGASSGCKRDFRLWRVSDCATS
jgi:hypothetical protein